jgi:glycerophosphoryl diester phosphodiesterase
MAGRFVSIAHHGTQTIEDYGTSENTVEGFRLAEAMGAGAVELDVRLTRDGVPILFHDAGFTSRLITGRFCQGDVADLTFAQIRANCRNKYGEKIYSLEEGLDGVMDETTLGGVWIDVKEPAVVAPALAVMAAADARAAARGRTPWALVMGLAEQDLVDAYVAAQPPPSTKCLVEFDPDVALATGCIAWGPRFTEGPQPEAVKAAQAKGLRVVFWTVDGDAFIQQFLGESQPNGMISDTPGLTFFYYQQQPFTPAGSTPP